MGQRKEPMRVLHVLGVTNLGGAESRIMDMYRSMDRDKVQFDFMVHTKKEGYFDKEIRSLGGEVYAVPRFRIYNYFSYKKAWKQFFEEHKEFEAVHGHMTSTAAIYLPIAKKSGVPVTIAHARSAGVDRGIKGRLTRFLRRNLAKRCDIRIACSALAAKAVFGDASYEAGNVKIIPNAIDVEKFRFSFDIRRSMREELGIQDKWVIGHAGRFHPAKNHPYLIKVFANIAKREPAAVLLLLGDGGEMASVKELVAQWNLEDKVIFMGSQKNIADYYQAMDYIVFPSFYEGLPGTIVEAQAAGLRCLISERIAPEVKCSDLVTFMSIEKEPAEWAEYVLAHKDYPREDMIEKMREHGFDVYGQVKMYEKIWRNT